MLLWEHPRRPQPLTLGRHQEHQEHQGELRVAGPHAFDAERGHLDTVIKVSN